MERKLAAILCADVYGFSRLMGENEEATHRTLVSYRKIIDSLIELHHGRFVNSAGDSVLAEFASVVNAVQCAVEAQAALKVENDGLPPARRMEFRIGINLGDVIVDGEQIYGDGVNLAARLESLAEPGGICVSRTVHDQVKSKLPLSFQDLGERSVKNIAEPVHVWRVLRDGSVPKPEPHRRSRRSYWRGGAFSIAGLTIIAVTFVVVQHVSLKPPHTHASIPPREKPALPLPDKPSIAVLPFSNMSGDREQEYFSDGITDDLISDLSRLPGLFVIARTSSFTYKGKTVPIQEVGRELGVKYILAGGVRKAGDQVRITVQLADATTGRELWAEHYDRPLRDIFALQDEIVHRIVTTLNLQLALAQRGFLIPRTTENLEAYDDVLRGTQYFMALDKDGIAKARQMFQRAIALDPKYAGAYAALGFDYFVGWIRLLSPDPNGLERAFQLEQQAIALDDSMPLAHSAMAVIYVHKGQYNQAASEAERGIALDPNSAMGYAELALAMNDMERPGEALQAVEKALRLDPRNGDGRCSFIVGTAYTQLGRYEEAIPPLKCDPTRDPSDHVYLVQDYVQLGQEDAARAEAAELERHRARDPGSALANYLLATAMNNMGEHAQALVDVQKALRLDPRRRDHYLLEEGRAYQGLGRYEDSIADFKDVIAVHPIFWAHLGLAVDYVELGRDDAARAEAAEVLRLNPQFNRELVFRTAGPKGAVLAENMRWSADLQKAGSK